MIQITWGHFLGQPVVALCCSLKFVQTYCQGFNRIGPAKLTSYMFLYQNVIIYALPTGCNSQERIRISGNFTCVQVKICNLTSWCANILCPHNIYHLLMFQYGHFNDKKIFYELPIIILMAFGLTILMKQLLDAITFF